MLDLFLSFYQLPNEEILFRRELNPMCEVFPRVASCTYWKYGTGGQAIGLQESCSDIKPHLVFLFAER